MTSRATKAPSLRNGHLSQCFGPQKSSTRPPSRRNPRWTKTFQDLAVAIDSSGLCPFVIFGPGAPEVASRLSATTGIDFTPEKIVECGERVWNLEWLFNFKAGFRQKTSRSLQGR
nr:aldehyde ferredoxin oxidoreductase C-terminal domain-containing protein [Acetomicrobium sp. S15 = DSM 107314]